MNIMRWSDLPLNPTTRTLRQFAALWVLFFGGLAAWEGLYRRQPAWGLVLGVLSLTVGPLGLWRPKWVRPIYVGWMIAAFPIGWLVSHVALAAVYYLVLTPLGLLARALGRDRLALRQTDGNRTNWSPLEDTADVRRYFRQF